MNTICLCILLVLCENRNNEYIYRKNIHLGLYDALENPQKKDAYIIQLPVA
jgi:hypothetical protein